MATQVQFRRGTETQNNNFTGVEGELSVNLTALALRLHDGTTTGGYEIARADMSNAVFANTVLPDTDNSKDLGASGTRFANVYATTFNGALSGNATTATTLETARNINGISFDGSQDITIEASIDKTLFISEGLEDSGGLTQFDGGTDVTLRLKNSPNFTDTNLLKWDNTNEQFVDSSITDNGTTVTINGNLNVTGSTTTINTTNLEVTDKLIIIGDGATDTTAADGAGFNIGTSGVSLTYDLANTSWTSSESWNLNTGKTYKIAGTTVIGSTSLGSGIVTSSLTSVGTLDDLTVAGTTSLQTNLTVGTTLEVSGAATFDSTTTVDGATLSVEDTVNGNYYALKTSIDSSNGTATIEKFGATSTFLKVNNFFIQSQAGETIAGFWTDGKVDLKYDGDTKLETLTDGVEISGDLYVKDTIRKDGTDLGLVEDAIVKLNQTGGNGYNFDEWSYTTYSACEYSVSCVNPTAGEQQFARFIIMATSGGNRYMTEYAGLSTDSANDLFTLGTASNSGNIRLMVTPSITNSDNDFRIKVTRYYR
tara:strand:- start:1772 stop:3385 length:1614 start_codon:yes stop_codon:yes gene_type:complete